MFRLFRPVKKIDGGSSPVLVDDSYMSVPETFSTFDVALCIPFSAAFPLVVPISLSGFGPLKEFSTYRFVNHSPRIKVWGGGKMTR